LLVVNPIAALLMLPIIANEGAVRGKRAAAETSVYASTEKQ